MLRNDDVPFVVNVSMQCETPVASNNKKCYLDNDEVVPTPTHMYVDQAACKYAIKMNLPVFMLYQQITPRLWSIYPFFDVCLIGNGTVAYLTSSRQRRDDVYQ